MTQLYLIRHAEAMAAIKGFVGDGGLSPLGVMQARRLRDRLAASGVIAADVLIASTFPRARQTAEIIAPQWLQIPSEKDEMHWHLVKYNDAFHLQDIGTPAHIPWGGILTKPASDQDRPSVPIESESFAAREQSDEAAQLTKERKT